MWRGKAGKWLSSRISPYPSLYPPCSSLHPADEHYFATLLAVLGREGEADCANWGVAAQDWGNGGAHPKAFA